MRNNYNRTLDMLNDEIIRMGGMVGVAIEDAVRSLSEKDTELAHKVCEGDILINQQEEKIEKIALNLLLTEQPVASDFRFVTTALKMITDLERIGDQASDIAYLMLKLNDRTYHRKDLGSITEMAKITVTMLEDALTAYINGDLDLTNEILRRDDLVDEYFRKVRLEVIDDVKEGKFTTKNSLDIFLIAKYLERIGDHAENIAERVYYSITGEQIQNRG